MATLYRKYRPQTFVELIGQNHIKITLQNEIAQGDIGHAYLFCGPRGLGKTTVARLLAKAINCENRPDKTSEPCNTCVSCQEITTSRSLDVMEIDAASHTGVDNVRENIIENARFNPTKSRFKVFIIDEVHMLSASAFNALLKTLEEPPARTVFILCTTETYKLPETIISRCQRFDFKRIASAELLRRLESLVSQEKKSVEESVLKNIVVQSEGCVRDAESLLGKILTLGDKITAEQAELVLPRSDFRAVAEFLEFLAEKNAGGAIELINKLIEAGADLQIFVANLLEFLRKIMLIKSGGSLKDFGVELDETGEKAAEKIALKFNQREIVRTIEVIQSKNREIKFSSIAQLPLELAIIELCGRFEDDSDDRLPPGSGEGGAPKIKDKIKEKLAHLKPAKKPAESLPLANTELPPLKPAEEAIKVDLISKSGKLKPAAFDDLAKIRECWPQIVELLLQKNYTLASLLKISRPLKFRDGVLEIGVQSNFYKGRVDEDKNRRIIENTIAEAIKAEIAVCGVVRPEITIAAETAVAEPAPEPIKPSDVVQDVMGMF